MKIKIFVKISSSHINENKIDRSLFVQEPFLRITYVESIFEEDIDMKNEMKIYFFSVEKTDAVCKFHADGLEVLSIVRDTAQ